MGLLLNTNCDSYDVLLGGIPFAKNKESSNYCKYQFQTSHGN